MLSSKRTIGSALVFTGSLLLAGSSMAGIIQSSQSLSFGLGTDASFEAINDFGTTTINDNSSQSGSGPTLIFDQYDEVANGSTLTGVMISFTGVLSGDLSTGADGDIQDLSVAVFSVLNSGMLSLDLGSPSGALGASFDELLTCDGTDFSGCTDSIPMLANVGSMLAPGVLAPYVGNGTFDISSTLASLVSVSTNPDNDTNYIDNATTFGLLENAFFDGSVTVKFTNDSSDVPEPGVLFLLAGGLLGLFIQHRRRGLRV